MSNRRPFFYFFFKSHRQPYCFFFRPPFTSVSLVTGTLSRQAVRTPYRQHFRLSSSTVTAAAAVTPPIQYRFIFSFWDCRLYGRPFQYLGLLIDRPLLPTTVLPTAVLHCTDNEQYQGLPTTFTDGRTTDSSIGLYRELPVSGTTGHFYRRPYFRRFQYLGLPTTFADDRTTDGRTSGVFSVWD